MPASFPPSLAWYVALGSGLFPGSPLFGFSPAGLPVCPWGHSVAVPTAGGCRGRPWVEASSPRVLGIQSSLLGRAASLQAAGCLGGFVSLPPWLALSGPEQLAPGLSVLQALCSRAPLHGVTQTWTACVLHPRSLRRSAPVLLLAGLGMTLG